MLTGCMYFDPINVKPRISPVACEIVGSSDRSCELVHRGDLLQLSVDYTDKDGDPSKASFLWLPHRCTDSSVLDCIEDAPVSTAR